LGEGEGERGEKRRKEEKRWTGLLPLAACLRLSSLSSSLLCRYSASPSLQSVQAHVPRAHPNKGAPSLKPNTRFLGEAKREQETQQPWAACTRTVRDWRRASKDGRIGAQIDQWEARARGQEAAGARRGASIVRLASRRRRRAAAAAGPTAGPSLWSCSPFLAARRRAPLSPRDRVRRRPSHESARITMFRPFAAFRGTRATCAIHGRRAHRRGLAEKRQPLVRRPSSFLAHGPPVINVPARRLRSPRLDPIGAPKAPSPRAAVPSPPALLPPPASRRRRGAAPPLSPSAAQRAPPKRPTKTHTTNN